MNESLLPIRPNETVSQAERLSRLEGGYEQSGDEERTYERVLIAVERFRAEAQIENERLRTEFRAENEFDLRAENERNKADIIKVIISVAGIGAALMAAGFAFLRFTGTG